MLRFLVSKPTLRKTPFSSVRSLCRLPSHSRYFSDSVVEKFEYAFVPIHQEKPKKHFVSTNPEFLEALEQERSSKKFPKLNQLHFSDTGKGETPSSVRRIPDEDLRKEIMVQARSVQVGASKVTPLCKLIRQMTVDEALEQLRFNPRRWTGELMKLIHKGVKIAELDQDLKREDLYVAVCYATRGKQHKRLNFHARGKTGIRLVKYSHLFVVLRDMGGKDINSLKLQERKLVKDKTKRQSPEWKKHRLLQALE